MKHADETSFRFRLFYQYTDTPACLQGLGFQHLEKMQQNLAPRSAGFLLYMISKEERIINKFGNQMLLSEGSHPLLQLLLSFFCSGSWIKMYVTPVLPALRKILEVSWGNQ